jgi:hypothetical protein
MRFIAPEPSENRRNCHTSNKSHSATQQIVDKQVPTSVRLDSSAIQLSRHYIINLVGRDDKRSCHEVAQNRTDEERAQET